MQARELNGEQFQIIIGGVWASRSLWPEAPDLATGAVLDGEIWIVHGMRNAQLLNSVWRYNPASDCIFAEPTFGQNSR